MSIQNDELQILSNSLDIKGNSPHDDGGLSTLDYPLGPLLT